MKPREITSLVRPKPIEWNGDARRISRAIANDDLRISARRRLPRAVFDYVDGGADDETTLRANRTAFSNWRFVPRTLAGVAAPDLSSDLFGRRIPMPLMLCPTGYTRMMHPDGERAVAAVARRSDVPYALSTMGSTTIEDLAASGHHDLWFQLYPMRDRGHTRALIERAAASGYRVLEVATDTTVAGRRERDVRNGLTIPPQLSLRTIADIGRHVGYWSAMVRSPVFQFANLGSPSVGGGQIDAFNIAQLFDPALDWDDLAAIRALWRGPLVLKGPVSPADAKRAVEAGVDGIHLSNHGGRQLDRCAPTIELVRPLRLALGEGPTIIVDSGVRHGADVAIAVARGADCAGIGRPYLYGLAAAGERGVARVLELFFEQLTRVLQLVGVASIAELRACGDELVVPTTAP